MRRNTRILLFFGVIWFMGVMLYVRNSDSDSSNSEHHKAKVHQNKHKIKKDKGKLMKSVAMNFLQKLI